MAKKKICKKKPAQNTTPPARLDRIAEESAKMSSFVHQKHSYKLQEAAIIMNCAYNTLRARILNGEIAIVRRPGAKGSDLRGAQITAEEIDRDKQSRSVRIASAS